MNEVEKLQLKNEILEELKNELMPNKKEEDVQSIFNEVRAKHNHNNGFSKLVGSFEGYKAWESVRKLACISVGAKYVRNIRQEDRELANRVAEQIFDLLCKAYIEHKNNTKERS